MSYTQKLAIIKCKYSQNSTHRNLSVKQNLSPAYQKQKNDSFRKITHANYKQQRAHNIKGIIQKNKFNKQQLKTPKNNAKIPQLTKNDRNLMCETVGYKQYDFEFQKYQKNVKLSKTQNLLLLTDPDSNNDKKDISQHLQMWLQSQKHKYKVNKEQSKQCIRQVEQTLNRIKNQLIDHNM